MEPTAAPALDRLAARWPNTFVVKRATVTVTAKDETGAPAPQTAITLNISGPNASALLLTTDSTGTAGSRRIADNNPG